MLHWSLLWRLASFCDIGYNGGHSRQRSTELLSRLSGALGHANPKVKEETLSWLQAEIAAEAKPALSKLAPLLLPPAAKCAEEATPSLREAAVGFMVAFALKARCSRRFSCTHMQNQSFYVQCLSSYNRVLTCIALCIVAVWDPGRAREVHLQAGRRKEDGH